MSDEGKPHSLLKKTFLIESILELLMKVIAKFFVENRSINLPLKIRWTKIKFQFDFQH